MFSTLRRLRWRTQPTLLHLTHAKGGSTWIDQLLREIFGERVLPRFGSQSFGDRATPPDSLEILRELRFEPGRIYPAMFLRRDELLTRPDFAAARRFVVLRDLRDTMVSSFFSLRDTHIPDAAGRIEAGRQVLRGLSKEDGFIYTFDTHLPDFLKLQQSWLGHGEIVLRYEDLIQSGAPLFQELFGQRLGMKIAPEKIERAVEACRFEKVFGRKLGELDEKSHGRQGLPGDWRNHFTPRLCAEFAARTGSLLVDAGYEADDRWLAGGNAPA